jgi:hypothetical protein
MQKAKFNASPSESFFNLIIHVKMTGRTNYQSEVKSEQKLVRI